MMKRIGVAGLICVLAAAFCCAQLGKPVAPVFRSDVRLVEVYATVFDQRGRPITGLTRDNFEVADNGEPQPILTFEASGSELSCAILLDTTGSMSQALPVVKNAVTRLIGELGENDWIAVYGFSTSLRLLQDFTRDKSAAKRAVLNLKTAGSTALFDAVAQVATDLSRRRGKKAIIAFTDGDDNSSYLNSTVAMGRVRKVGVPLYTVAEGEALQSRSLLEQLEDISRRTGGYSYAAKKTHDVENIFQDISRDLNHTYMLAYTAPEAPNDKWRSIQLIVKGLKRYKIRAKEGYEPN